MKRIQKYYFNLIIILFLSTTLNSQNDTLTIKEAKKDTIVFNEGIAYKMLYENQRDSNNDILSTIFYALGGLGAAVLLVFGSTWWFNEQKVKDLLKALDQKVQDIKSDSSIELSEKMNALIIEKNKELNSFQTQIKNQLIDESKKNGELSIKAIEDLKEENNLAIINYQELLKTYNENLQLQITTINTNFSQRIDLISQDLSKLKESNEKELKEYSNNLTRDTLEHKAAIASLKGNENIALMAYIEYALFLFKSKEEFTFQLMYNEIMDCLEKAKFIYDDEFEGLEKLTKISIKKFPDITDEIKEGYKDLKVKKL